MRPIYFLVIALLLTLFCSDLFSQKSAVLHTATSASNLRLQLKFNSPELDTLLIDNRAFVCPNLVSENGLYFHQIDGLPVAGTALALPHASQNPRLTITNENWENIQTSLPLAPPAQIQPDGELTYFSYQAQTSDQAAPSPAVSLDRTAWFRNLKVAHLTISPTRLQNNQLQYLRSAEVILQWENTASGASIQSFDAGREFNAGQDDFDYAQSVLNKSDATRFLKPRAKPAAKSANFANRDFLLVQVTENGWYQITGADLTAQNISLSGLQSDQIRMYNNGGRTLPEKPSDTRPETLIEIPILVNDGGDGSFDPDDTIQFFGASVHDWEYSQTEARWRRFNNPYTNENVYWLSWDAQESAAKRLAEISIAANAGQAKSAGLNLQKIETDIVNPINSGRDWYGRELSLSDATANYSFNRTAGQALQNGRIYLRVVSKTSGRHTVSLGWNQNSLNTYSFFGSTGGDYLDMNGQTYTANVPNTLIQAENTLTLNYSNTLQTGSLFVDWVEFIAEDDLAVQDGELTFAAAPSSGIETWRVTGAGSDARIFEISNPVAPRTLAFTQQGETLIFADSMNTATPKRYFIADVPKAPAAFERYTTSDIRGSSNTADMLVVTHSDFLDEANRFAEHKRSVRNFEVAVVDVNVVMKEFGWGLMDPTAIRDFVAYAFHNWQKQPQYLVLFGDGVYDYRGIGRGINQNFVPTFQTTELEELVNRNLEAYYTYVNGDDRDMDLSMGRIPAQTIDEARNFVDKLIEYETKPEFGFWRTILTMVADDELVTGGRDNGEVIHTKDAEIIAERHTPDYLNLSKIYLTEYEGVRTASVSGVRKPQAQQALIDRINSGTLVLNYVGHGNSTQWAHEVVFELAQDFPSLQNDRKYPFIVAATCDFGRYDKLNSQSFPEELLFARGKGAVGLFTSSRVVYAQPNATFNKAYYDILFTESPGSISIGEALILARMQTPAGFVVNDEKFTILGDPSLRLAIPTSSAQIISVSPDTLFALNKTNIIGTVQSFSEVPISAGEVELVVFDDKKRVRYLTSRNSPIDYILPGNLIFRGKGALQGELFDMNFIVPKDVTYGGRTARMSVYGVGDNWEALGYRESIPISLRSGVLFDEEGPEITVSFSDREFFASGDPITRTSSIIATIADSVSGVNLTGEIGHKITLTIDGDTENRLDLTQNFVYFENDFLSGQLTAQLPKNLAPGLHLAELKAWDNSNNSSRKQFEFILTEDGELTLSDVLNYPNPFQESTAFTFILNADAEVKISVYTVAGRLIQTLENIAATPGFNQVPWDGLDADGDELANGVYLYRIVAKSVVDGEDVVIEQIEKLAIQR